MKSDKKIDRMMERLAEAGIKFSKDNFGVALDYSEESLKLVESILEALYASIPPQKTDRQKTGNGPTDKQIQSVALMMGAYIGVVIKKRWRARWYMKKFHNEEIHALEVMGRETFPVNKAYKRLTLGAGDNVWEYYNSLTQLG